MMRRCGRLNSTAMLMTCILLATSHRTFAEDSTTPAAPSTIERLATQQQRLADKYQRLEMLMLKMAEFDTTSHPQRSTLLKQALTRSKDNRIFQQMLELTDLLRDERLKQATDDQTVVREQLAQLLELLLSENRADRLKQEQDRVKNYIKEVERILRQQRGVQGRTEGGDDARRLAQDQGNIADRTDRLADEIEENERPADHEPDPTDDPSPDGDRSAAEPTADQTPEPGEQVRITMNDGRVVEGTVTESDSQKVVVQDQKDETHELERADIESIEPAPAEGTSPSETPSPGDSPKPDPGQPSQGQPSQGQPSQGQPSQGQPSQGQPSQGQPSQGQPSQGQPSQGQPSQGQPSQGQPSQGQPSQGQPSQGQPSQGQPSQGQPSQGQPSQGSDADPPEALPGQHQIQQALEQMREAQERLEDAERDEAIPAQQQARRLLEEAKAQLEEILRQMREEEIERALAQLESRFRKMLEMQIKVYEDTQQLSELTAEDREGRIIVQSGRLSVDEQRIIHEADKALLLLREEGSSVAFPEAVEQMREDMVLVVDRLGQAKIDMLTLGLEQDIVTALEEIVEALQKAQQDAEQRRQRPPSPMQPMSPEDTPLVDAIAELKMIRTLQVRVNRRTKTYARMLSDPDHTIGQATDQDLIESLEHLSQRERRIYEITRDLILEKNK